jgi:diguanylate cyclase (GGDEF)-like protein
MRWVLCAFLTLASCAAGSADGDPADAADAAPLAAGEPAFESIGMRQGLTSSSIYSILVDRHGFVWFAGDNGVHRYDGQTVHTIDREPDRADTLSSRTNAAIEQTKDATWILSFAGELQRLDAATGSISTIALARDDARRPGRGTRMVVDAADVLWIGTDVGLFRFDPRARTSTSIALGAGAEARVTLLGLAADGKRLFAGGVDGRVYSLDPADPLHVELLFGFDEEPGAPVPLALAASADALWLGTTQGVYRYDLAKRTLDRGGVPLEAARDRVKAIAVGRDGVVWFGGEHRSGLFRYDPASGAVAVYRHHPDDPHSLSSDRIHALSIDAHDNLWIGLVRDGANRLRTSQAGAVTYRDDGQPGNSFCAVRELPDGRLAVSRCGGSLAVLDPRTGAVTPRDAELDAALDHAAPTLTSHAIVSDGRGGFWLPSDGLGLLHWEVGAGAATRLPTQSADGAVLPNPYMNDALLDSRGRLWVACSLGLATLTDDGAALRLLDPATEPGSLLTGGVLRVSEGAGGALWIGSTQGLLRYEPDARRVERFRHDPRDTRSLSDDLVVATLTTRDGALWVGTQAGLNRAVATGGKLVFKRYGLAEGLPDQTVNALVEDANGGLWAGTNRGIATYDAARDRFRAYAPADGVPDDTVNWRAGALTSDGSVWFGTFSGLLRIYPERLGAMEPQPLMLSSYEIGGRARINLGGPVVEPLATTYTAARVRFNVTTFGARRPLSYRLLGLEPAWQNMPASQSVGYDPLPAGEYRFEVRQMGRDGAWEPPALSVPLAVEPPPWRTSTAYMLYALALIGALALVASGYRAKLDRERRHVRELHQLANFDVLTGLPNRTNFSEQLARALTDSAPLALIFIDLDRFKNINDSLGHRFGDQVLVAATRRFREALPAAAELARLGGDEFTVVLPRLHNEREAALVAQRLLDAFATPLRVDGSDVVVTLSLGISLAPVHASDPATLIQYADSAMYYAKAAGRNTFRFFHLEMIAQV